MNTLESFTQRYDFIPELLILIMWVVVYFITYYLYPEILGLNLNPTNAPVATFTIMIVSWFTSFIVICRTGRKKIFDNVEIAGLLFLTIVFPLWIFARSETPIELTIVLSVALIIGIIFFGLIGFFLIRPCAL